MHSLRIDTSDKVLEQEFNWALRKGMDCVMTSKIGPVNSSEMYGGEKEVTYMPCYRAGLPYRSAFYIRDFCHQAVGAHLIGLDAENASMSKAFLSTVAKSRQWYPLWALNYDGSIYSLDYRNDEEFSRYVPAVFELVETVYTMYMWTGDRTFIDDPEFMSPISEIMSEFVEYHDKVIPDGVAEGKGNIFKGMSSYSESNWSLAESADAIASQYRACMAYAAMLDIRKEKSEARKFYDKADQLKAYFASDWTVAEYSGEGSYICGITSSGHQVPGFAYEASIFPVLKGIADKPVEFQPHMSFCDRMYEGAVSQMINISSLTYLPDMFFLYGDIETGWKWTQKLLSLLGQDHIIPLVGNNRNYPETAFTLISNVIVNMMGVEPDAQHDKLLTLSRLPDEITWLGVENIPVGNHIVNIRHDSNKCTTVAHVSGERDLRCVIRFYGDYNQFSIDGTTFNASKSTLNGRLVSYVEVSIPVGSSVRVSASIR